MKSEKGITLLSLIIYLILLMFAIGILAIISNYFHSNLNHLSSSGKYAVEFNKFNMFFVEDVKNNTKIYSAEPHKITFGDGTTYTFVNNGIYRNKVKICDNIYSLIFEEERITDENNFQKTVVKVDLAIVGDKVFRTINEYVLNYWKDRQTTTTKVTIADVSTIAEAKTKNAEAVDTGITTLKDDNDKEIKIPAKFKIAEDSATVREDGIVIEDAKGNQFVWIPVDDIANYKRTDFGKQNGSYSDYSETVPTDEQTSVTNNKGYYIGRFEAGDSAIPTSENSELRVSGASVTNDIAIKKGYAPYNFVTRDEAKVLAEGMDTKEGYDATTKLCSSYSWDTAINFIQNKVADYGTSSPQGNYRDTTFAYTDIKGASQEKINNAGTLVPTGQTIPLCSIYDIGGNLSELTIEMYLASNDNIVFRGGNTNDNNNMIPAGHRAGNDDATFNNDVLGFRVALFL